MIKVEDGKLFIDNKDYREILESIGKSGRKIIDRQKEKLNEIDASKKLEDILNSSEISKYLNDILETVPETKNDVKQEDQNIPNDDIRNDKISEVLEYITVNNLDLIAFDFGNRIITEDNVENVNECYILSIDPLNPIYMEIEVIDGEFKITHSLDYDFSGMNIFEILSILDEFNYTEDEQEDEPEENIISVTNFLQHAQWDLDVTVKSVIDNKALILIKDIPVMIVYNKGNIIVTDVFSGIDLTFGEIDVNMVETLKERF